jgi:hypothetical protein
MTAMKRTAQKANGKVPALRPDAIVVALAPVRALARTRQEVTAARPHCPKCASAFVAREPAFLHCYYCGHMARIPTGSLLAQELFELRSGFRIAS